MTTTPGDTGFPQPRFLSGDRALSALAIALFLTLFVVYPMTGPVLGFLADLALSAVVASAVFAIVGGRAVKRMGLGLAAVALVSMWLSHASNSRALLAWREMAALVFLAFVAFVVLRQVFSPGRITFHRVLGAVVVYLLLGLVFSGVYNLLELFVPGSFDLGTVAPGADVVEVYSRRLLYFSLVTLTTLGYGDITPLSLAARHLALLEALVGQLYPAILIARLVSLELAHRPQDP